MTDDKPESITFADIHREEVVRNFVKGWIEGIITVDLSNLVLGRGTNSTIRKDEYKDYEKLISLYSGATDSTLEERIDAERKLYTIIVSLRMSNRIKGKLEMSVTNDIKVQKLTEKMDALEESVNATNELVQEFIDSLPKGKDIEP